MIQMADEVFEARTDPDQLQVNEEVLDRLRRLHPACVSGVEDEEGPMVWVLLIPTTESLMKAFLNHQLSENELYLQTPEGGIFDAIYLCSAMVLEEYRRKGLAKRVTMQAIGEIQKQHPIRSLFVWSFTREGDAAAEAIAQEANLPLYRLLDQ